jgi:ligand-binding sensor protein/AraC-like DNA-binding protein
MIINNSQLANIINIYRWEQLQDHIANVTKMAIITADYKGVPVTKHSNCQPFCEMVRKDKDLSAYCEKCDSRGGVEAMRLNAPYIYLCHYNILDAAIPIVINNVYMGAVLIGQVLLSEKQDIEKLEQICRSSDKVFYGKEKLAFEQHWRKIPHLSLGRVKTIVNMLYYLCGYIINEAAEKDAILQITLTQGQVLERGRDEETAFSIESLKNIKDKLNNAISNARVPGTVAEIDQKPGSILMPAFRWINEHKSERNSIKDVAKLCYVSPNYFSKLFVRETGENYSAFLARKRVEWSKNLLESTNRYIFEIAADVGFSDSGHFVRTFKRFEGITPAGYRKIFQNK